MHVKKDSRKLTKLEEMSKIMAFTSYEIGTKAYRCLDPVTFKLNVSRDVIFEEEGS